MSERPEEEVQDSLAPPVAEHPASMSYVKRVVRAKLRRREEAAHEGLNIYPMMDMMTILLVFMVMQFASSTAAVVQESEELRIPVSTSKIEMGEALSVVISRSAVLVDQEQVLELRNGLVDPSQKQGGGSGFLITPLNKELRKVRDFKKQIAAKNPRRPFDGEVAIIADQRTPFRTLSEVIYTLGQSEFKNLRFVVNKKAYR